MMTFVTSRSHRYGDVTITYIRRSEIPSCIYAKHWYMQESEYESTVVIYILAIITQVAVITGHDIISQEYKITRKRKSRMYNMKYGKVLTLSLIHI